MQAIRNRLTKRLNVKTPILSAPMGIPGMKDIATAVTSAGGFGFIGNTTDGPAVLKENMRKLREKFAVPPQSPLPFGFGFLGWVLDQPTDNQDDQITAVLEGRPAVIWFSFGNDLGKYVTKVRDYEADREHKTLIFVIINTLSDALRAANEWKVDAIVVQGNEASGHGNGEAPPMFNLVQGVLKAIPKNGPFVIAAGGISTGAQIAGLLTMGVDGVVLGTRFLFTPECSYPAEKKQVLIEADLNATTRSMAFDEVSRSTGWPDKVDGRAVVNEVVKDYQEGLSLEKRLKLFDEGEKRGEKDRLVVWAGIGAGLVNEIKPAADVLKELHNETVQHLQAATTLLS